jgi:hypothetical protein
VAGKCWFDLEARVTLVVLTRFAIQMVHQFVGDDWCFVLILGVKGYDAVQVFEMGCDGLDLVGI